MKQAITNSSLSVTVDISTVSKRKAVLFLSKIDFKACNCSSTCIIQEEMFAEGRMLGTWLLQGPPDADTVDGFKDTLWTDTMSMQPSLWNYTSC